MYLHICTYSHKHIHTDKQQNESSWRSEAAAGAFFDAKCPLCLIRRGLYSYRWEEGFSSGDRTGTAMCFLSESSLLLARGAVTSLLSVSPMCRSGGSSSVRVSLSSSQPTPRLQRNTLISLHGVCNLNKSLFYNLYSVYILHALN